MRLMRNATELELADISTFIYPTLYIRDSCTGFTCTERSVLPQCDYIHQAISLEAMCLDLCVVLRSDAQNRGWRRRGLYPLPEDHLRGAAGLGLRGGLLLGQPWSPPRPAGQQQARPSFPHCGPNKKIQVRICKQVFIESTVILNGLVSPSGGPPSRPTAAVATPISHPARPQPAAARDLPPPIWSVRRRRHRDIAAPPLPPSPRSRPR
jgi:hypothetical protein